MGLVDGPGSNAGRPRRRAPRPPQRCAPQDLGELEIRPIASTTPSGGPSRSASRARRPARGAAVDAPRPARNTPSRAPRWLLPSVFWDDRMEHGERRRFVSVTQIRQVPASRRHAGKTARREEFASSTSGCGPVSSLRNSFMITRLSNRSMSYYGRCTIGLRAPGPGGSCPRRAVTRPVASAVPDSWRMPSSFSQTSSSTSRTPGLSGACDARHRSPGVLVLESSASLPLTVASGTRYRSRPPSRNSVFPRA